MQSNEMFSGVKVLELASVLAGPAVGQFLAELGAEVIKVENPLTGGDVTRSWKLESEAGEGITSYFSSVNWGKKSISLNLSDSRGVELLYRLVEDTDIIISSFKPGDAGKLGVDYKILKKINPSLIYGRVTGYGNNDRRVGYDAIIQAEAGFMAMNGTPETGPLKMPVALVDILAAHHLKEGILLAYINRLKTGKGSEVSVSLIEAAVASLANQAANWLVGGQLPGPMGSAHPNIAPYGEIFLTKDNVQVILAIGTDAQFKKLCKVLGIEELADDMRFRKNSSRIKNRGRLTQVLTETILALLSSALLAQLLAENVPAGVVNNMKSAVALDSVRNLRLEANNIKGLKTFSAYFHENSENNSHFLPPPIFGQHTDEVLSGKLLLSSESLQKLRNNAII